MLAHSLAESEKKGTMKDPLSFSSPLSSLYLPSPLLTKEGNQGAPSPLEGEGWGEGELSTKY